MSLDTSIVTCGFSVFSYSGKNVNLKRFGLIKTDSSLETDEERIRFLLRRVGECISQWFPSGTENVIIAAEKPPATIYGGGPANVIKGRFSKIYKLILAYSSLMSFCALKDIRFFYVLPIDWQKSRDRSIEVKKWSLRQANSILKVFNKDKVLKTKADENIADAINIGLYTVKRYSDE